MSESGKELSMALDVIQRIQDRMPVCEGCGYKFNPSSVGGNYVLVCVTCACMEATTNEWMEQQMTAAWAEVIAEAEKGNSDE